MNRKINRTDIYNHFKNVNIHRSVLTANNQEDLIKQYEKIYKEDDGKLIHITFVSGIFHANDGSCSMFYDYRLLEKAKNIYKNILLG